MGTQGRIKKGSEPDGRPEFIIPPPLINTQRPLREWILVLGLPSLALGLGAGMMGLAGYWPGVFIVYAALVFFLVDLWMLREIRQSLQKLGSTVIVVGIVLLTWYVFRPAPLGSEIKFVATGYTEGDVDGFEWKPQFADVRVTLNIPKDANYEDLDVVFDPGEGEVMQMAQLSAWPDVTLSPTNTIIPRHTDDLRQFKVKQTFTVNQFSINEINGVNPKTGEHVKQPIIQTPKHPAGAYRILWSKAPSGTSLQLIAVVARVGPHSEGHLSEAPILFVPIGNLNCMRVVGTYKSHNRPLSFDTGCVKSY